MDKKVPFGILAILLVGYALYLAFGSTSAIEQNRNTLNCQDLFLEFTKAQNDNHTSAEDVERLKKELKKQCPSYVK
ncbi:hypothetical protein ACOGST_004672 [Vibrio alginolyticus]|nr:hypothetical protein [Vibrio alginolyticus]